MTFVLRKKSNVKTGVTSHLSVPDYGIKLTYLGLLDLRALLGFERRQSANKGLPLGSVKDHLGGIGGVEASRIIEIVLD